jgi:outer membrane protein OmpA-like peptidoglycan-associated protein
MGTSLVFKLAGATLCCAGVLSYVHADPEFFGHAADAPKKIVLEGIQFDPNRGVLLPPSFPELDRAAATLKNKWGVTRVEVGGHSDSRGSDAYNLALSQRRAETVRGYLIEKGLSADRLVARGYGKTRPVAANATEAGRYRNRRVELLSLD